MNVRRIYFMGRLKTCVTDLILEQIKRAHMTSIQMYRYKDGKVKNNAMDAGKMKNNY